jgi:endonuclease/exonuclease/phosphatase family metal-dependent hydrolase
VRVVSLNAGRNESDFFGRVDAMASGFDALGADIIFLQEVLSVPVEGIDTSLELARRLGMSHAHEPQRLKPRRLYGKSVSSTSGLTVLTRLPARSSTAIVLPSVPEDGERISQIVEVDTEIGPLLLVNVHLTFLPGADADRLRFEQMRLTLAQAGGGAPARTAIIAGDFNTAPGDTAFDHMANDGRFDFGPGPLDALPSTYLGGLLETSHASGRAIDHIAVYHPDGVPALRIATRFLALTEPDAKNGVLASDHAAVVADLVFVRRVRAGDELLEAANRTRTRESC